MLTSATRTMLQAAWRASKSLALVIAGLTFWTTSTGFAQSVQTVLSDNFDSYTNGDLVGQGGWLQTSTTATNPIQVAGIVDKYAVLGTAGGQDVYDPFSSVVPHTDGNSLTTSLRLNVGSATAGGDYFTHLSNPAGTASNFYQRLFARSLETGYELGLLAASGTGSSTTWGGTQLDFGTEYDVDVTWNFVVGTQNDIFNVSVEGSNYLSHTWNSTSVQEPADLAAFNFRQGSSSSSPLVNVYGLSVSVVPEPASLALLGCGAVGMIAYANRRLWRRH